jgi:hypothetical protein
MGNGLGNKAHSSHAPLIPRPRHARGGGASANPPEFMQILCARGADLSRDEPCGLLTLGNRLCARRSRPCNQGIMSRIAGLGIRKETRAYLAASPHQTGRLYVPRGRGHRLGDDRQRHQRGLAVVLARARRVGKHWSNLTSPARDFTVWPISPRSTGEKKD